MAVVASVAINLDSRGVPAKLKQIADRGKEVDRSLNGAAAATTKAGREFKNAGNAASQAAGGFNKLGKAIGGIITAAAALQALKFTIVSTAELETQTRSLKVLTGSLETARKIVQQLQDIGAVTPFTSTELIDTAKRLSAFGVETEKLVDTTRRLGDVAGATGADLGGIATAFGQIQAKGRLQGEELLQLQERGIDLQSELQRMYGLTGEEFRKALEKGRFSAEAVDVALQNLTNTGGKYANGAIAQSDTLAGKFSTLQDGITRTAQALGQVLSPALQTILDQAIGVVNSINNALAAGRRIQQFGISAQRRNELYQQAGREAQEIALLRGGGRLDPAVFNQLRDERFRDLIERFGYETGQIQVETKAPTLETPRVPELLGGGGGAAARGAGAGAAAAKDAQRAADAAAREAEQRRINLRNQDQLIERLRAQVVLQNSFTDGDRIMNQLLLDQLEIRQDIENRMEGASAAMKQLLIQEADLRSRLAMDKAAEPFVRAGMNMGESLAEGIGKAKEETDLLNQALAGAGDIIGNQLRGAIDGLIDGTADWNDILRNTLSQLGSFFLNFGLNQLAGPAGSGGILSFLGFGTRANGGPVNANQPYIVGERGPELFVPFQQGNITSNEELEAQMRERSSSTQLTTNNNFTSEILKTQMRETIQQSLPFVMSAAERRAELKEQEAAESTKTAANEAALKEMGELSQPYQQSTALAVPFQQEETKEESDSTTSPNFDALLANLPFTERVRESREVMLPFTRNAEQASMVAAERETAQAISNPGPIDVRYESSVINGVEYITAEQHRKGMAQAAERGRQLTLQALQGSVKTRKKVGL